MMRQLRITSERYWERVTRLLPFGERCFEAAVYIMAASMCVRELEFIAFVASYGDKIVKCIGVFFGARVAIELLFVFINEAFGMYAEDRPVDQKGLTLVPLLQSFCQYALYFGSGLFILRVFEVDTTQATPDDTAEAILTIVQGKTKGHEPGSVDWSSEVLSWY